jgi:hypothetical protein
MALVSGTELPHGHRDLKSLVVVVSCGQFEIRTKAASNQDGTAEWFDVQEITMELPEDMHQMPDVFVYLAKQGTSSLSPICFARYTVAELLMSSTVPAFWPEYRWITLQVSSFFAVGLRRVPCDLRADRRTSLWMRCRPACIPGRY